MRIYTLTETTHTRIIGAQSAITTPILFFAASKQETMNFLQKRNISAPQSDATNVFKSITSWKEFMPLESSYMNTHYGFCWNN